MHKEGEHALVRTLSLLYLNTASIKMVPRFGRVAPLLIDRLRQRHASMVGMW